MFNFPLFFLWKGLCTMMPGSVPGSVRYLTSEFMELSLTHDYCRVPPSKGKV